MHLLQPNKHKEDCHIRKPNNGNFLFEIEDRKYIYVGEILVSFETNDKIVIYSSNFGFNDIKFSFAYGKQSIAKYLRYASSETYSYKKEYENSTEKDQYQYVYEKMVN